ncbi:MAG TPA: 2-C-methyl-D-erythritol 4-phosphate cytidylyltransferase [Acidobacteriota bacterium]|nr:2-C-methyl-D-erythritol 4-phosphate cytidylyltransferase [Acidobacteriota bacterium]
MIGLILPAAGSGSRFGSEVPKQFLPLDGVPIYLCSLRAFEPFIDFAVVLVPPGWEDRVRRETADLCRENRLLVEVGGEHRQDSVRRGLMCLPPVDIVVVHDAARPFVTPDLINRVIETTRREGACIPGLPVNETVKLVHNSVVTSTLDRSTLMLAQTPQGFRRDILQKAFEKAYAEGYYGTDESVLVERMGIPVSVVPGEPGNIKITLRHDLSGR